MTFTNILIVGAGGFLGSVARYVTSVSIDQKFNSSFPYGTFTVNLIGAFVLGLVYGWAVQNSNEVSNTKLFLITGFCGGFTTFSAFAFENFDLINNRMTSTALLYSVSTLVFGVLLVWLGTSITKNL